jgi:hypothetical protein
MANSKPIFRFENCLSPIIALILLGAWCAPINSQSGFMGGDKTQERSYEEVRKMLANPRVAVAVTAEEPIASEIKAHLIQGLRRIKGVEIVTSDPVFTIQVVAVLEPDGYRHAMSVVVIGPGSMLSDHRLLTGGAKILQKNCESIVADFELREVARYR